MKNIYILTSNDDISLVKLENIKGSTNIILSYGYKVKENMEQDASSWTIKTSTIPETNLLIVSVTSPTPDLSFRVLQLVIEHYSSISDYIFSNAQLEVIRDPIIPVAPVNPLNLKKNYLRNLSFLSNEFRHLWDVNIAI